MFCPTFIDTQIGPPHLCDMTFFLISFCTDHYKGIIEGLLSTVCDVRMNVNLIISKSIPLPLLLLKNKSNGPVYLLIFSWTLVSVWWVSGGMGSVYGGEERRGQERRGGSRGETFGRFCIQGRALP